MKKLSPHQQWEDFIHHGLPTRHDESWKYTDLTFLANKKFTIAKRIVSPSALREKVDQYRLLNEKCILLVLVDGDFVPVLSDIKKLPMGVIIDTRANAVIKHARLLSQQLPEINAKKYPFAHMNSITATEGLFIYLPDECELPLPIHLLSLAVSEEEFIAHPQHLFILGERSKLVVFEEYAAISTQAYMMNILTTFIIGKTASLLHHKIQTENKLAVHIASTFVKQKQDSSTAFTNFSSGATFARDEIVVTLSEPGADCRTAGFYRLQHDNQYIDHHIDIVHSAPRSSSEILYKGTLDKKSRAVFNGRVCVEENAQKISAVQANHNLLLSPQAEVYSKPELEIYADDVKCKHGATTGQLDQDALFYMRARGIERPEAVTILLQGFSEDIIQRVSHPGMRQRAQESIL
jgi:Fe-S cluster assembly protein SufD